MGGRSSTTAQWAAATLHIGDAGGGVPVRKMDQRENRRNLPKFAEFIAVVARPARRAGVLLALRHAPAVKTYGQFCPIAQALEILAERWTLLVIRELLTGSHRFGEIQRGVPLMSRTLLSQRLKTLQEQELVRRTERGGAPHYELTEAGDDPELAGMIAEFREDERAHRDAAIAAGAERAPVYPLLAAAIRLGCRAAIRLSERI